MMGLVDRSRHEELLPVKVAAEKKVMIVGCGAIGSWTAILMGKMGFEKFMLIDPDQVEPVNVSVQAFGVSSLGMKKVDAVKRQLVREFELDPEAVETADALFDGKHAKDVDVCIASMDNLLGRQTVWKAMKDRCKLFVDPRMGGQWFELYAIDPKIESHLREYEKVINPSDLTFSPDPCAARAVAYTAAVAGSLVANAIRQWAVDHPDRIKIQLFDLVKGDMIVIDPAKCEDRTKTSTALVKVEVPKEKIEAVLMKPEGPVEVVLPV